MDLILIEKRRGPDDDRYSWQPFASSEEFNDRWWNNIKLFGDTATYLEVHRAGTEVARVELDEHVYIEHYLDVPPLGDTALEVQLIEIHKEQRRQGIATEVVRLLARTHPTRRLVAFSEEADQFWDTLGWRRHEHPEGSLHMRPLYIQPAAWPPAS
ncbi:hypothetical protein GCM10027176_36720 [Actinoallomurus bryophytorum]|uniref:Acetyltransferase (GNAT) family protein n=1 Tax=Actinoallomurus bryophytorum TaxID=1490222 RepID=A0A543CIS0_9ACTN|nr:GNAT family N-acetyltransferase [Actinoallomurus bryophytorum]TQL97002.1 hypothetical protein FB559_2570 [Actinoallomurus bryophytorum]